jgi:hypothetical protein
MAHQVDLAIAFAVRRLAGVLTPAPESDDFSGARMTMLPPKSFLNDALSIGVSRETGLAP